MSGEDRKPTPNVDPVTSLGIQPLRQRSDSCGDLQAFFKSRKTDRSPVFKRKEREEQNETALILQAMKAMEKNLEGQLKKQNEELKNKMEEDKIEMRKVIEEVKNEVKRIKENEIQWEIDRKVIQAEIKKWEEENIAQKESIKNLEEKIKNLESQPEQQEKATNSLENRKQEERLLTLERNLEREEKEKRKSNIIIKGKRFEKVNLIEEVKQFLADKLEVEAEIMFAKSIKMGQNENILAKIGSQQQKNEIMKAKAKLRSETEKIFIENDLTYEERNIQRKIKIMAQQQRNEGKEVKIGYQKLKIEDVWHKWDYKTATLKKAGEDRSKN